MNDIYLMGHPPHPLPNVTPSTTPYPHATQNATTLCQNLLLKSNQKYRNN